MRLVIIESPYAGKSSEEITQNIQYARMCIRDSLERGEAPIASHLLYTQPGIFCDGVLVERQWGIVAGLAWYRVAEYGVFYTDRGWSKEMLAAREFLQKEKRKYIERSLQMAHLGVTRG